MSIERRRLVFEGRQLVAGLLLSDSPSARAAVLEFWRPGAVVQRCADALLLRFAKPMELDCDVVRGEPLVERVGVLVAVPLRAREFDALAPAKGSVVIARAGRVFTVRPAPEELDPSEWLDLSPATIVQVPRPELAVAPAPLALAPRPLELRPDPKLLPPEASRALVDALGTERSAPRQTFWRRTMTSLLRWWRGRRQPPALPSGGDAPRPGLAERAEQWVNRQLDRTPVGRWMDDFNRKYVDRLLKMFDEEALEDALKHAVPLSRKTAEPGAQPTHLPFGARQNLELNMGGRRIDRGPAGVMQPGVYETLRARYRAAADKLEKAGRIDEAAFVLADLLDAPQEAVDLLERHEKFEKAARLAEGRTLAPEVTVRLWVLAKDLERATLLARRHRVFGAVVTRLERGNLAEARVLRLQWGEWLASSGDFGGAVQAVSPLEEARSLMLQWVDLGIEAGGPQRAPLLVKRLELEPKNSANVVQRAFDVLGDRSEVTASERAALGEALMSSLDAESLEQRKPLARAALRAMVRDEAALGVTKPGVVGRLIAFDDGALRADVPSYAPGVRPLTAQTTRFERESTALTPFDAVLLPSGALLVALGENGIALVNHHGRVTWRADVPAFSLVASDEGPTVLALAPREDVTSVSRISVATKRAQRWAEVQLSCFSPTFRDGIWFIGAGPRVLGLDVLGERPTPLWELPPGPDHAPVRVIASSAPRVTVLTSGFEIGRRAWRLPSFDAEFANGLHQAQGIEAMAVSPEGGFVLVGTGANGELRTWSPAVAANQPLVTQPLPGKLAGTPASQSAWQALPTKWRQETPDQLDVILRPGQHSLGFGHATTARTRFLNDTLIICCDNGHVVCFDLTQQRVVRDVTVKP
ncbi:MAG: hypothetical protein GQE15_09035 [Archangiaceae bacterium]|nr:hypothetical protein [Archangiaceae bacterium]